MERSQFKGGIMESRWLLFIGLFAAFVLAPVLAMAGPTLEWEPSAGDVVGYRVFFGTSSGKLPDHRDAGNATRYSIGNLPLQDNATYHFAVRAYNDFGESPDSNRISWTSGDSTPPIPPRGLAFEAPATLRWTPNEEADLNGYRLYHGESSRDYGPFIPVSGGARYEMAGLEAGKTYYFAVTAADTSGNESGFSAEVGGTIPAAADTVAPEIAILQPTDAGYFVSEESGVRLAGTASDNVAVTAVTWSADTGASGRANGTETWETPNLTLEAGETTVTVIAADAAGNRSEATIRIALADPEPIPGDFTVSDLRAASGKAYVLAAGLRDGEASYIDRNFRYARVPSALVGSHYIRVANNDKGSRGDDFLRFTVSRDAMVYVVHDDRMSDKPSWLADFEDTGATLVSESPRNPMGIYRKRFPAGEVVLGGNTPSRTSYNMYTVVVRDAAETPTF